MTVNLRYYRMTIKLAKRLTSLKDKNIAFLDCGKRGGAAFLAEIADVLSQKTKFQFKTIKKSSAHTCASKTVIDKIASEFDAVIYGVVNCASASSCSLRDSIELEFRNIPVALVTATTRIPTVRKQQGVYILTHCFADRFNEGWFSSPMDQRNLAKFGYHRQLRLAGCQAGDRVEINGQRIPWVYPSAEFEASKWNWPSGFAKWHLRQDGIKQFKAIETPDPTVDLSAADISYRVEDLIPKIQTVLLANSSKNLN